MRVTRFAVCFGASFVVAACAFDPGDDKPRPAEGSDTHVGATGESALCVYGTTPEQKLPDLGAIELVGEGEGVKLTSAPSDPAYSATYPIPGLNRMTVRIEATTDLVPTCISKTGGVTDCTGDHPFYARLRGSTVDIFDVYGKVVFRAEVPPPPKRTCIVPDGGALPVTVTKCPNEADIKNTFCSDVSGEIGKVLDCTKLDDPAAITINVPPNATKAACGAILAGAVKKASEAMAGCAEVSNMVSTWASSARAQMLNFGVCSGSPLVLDLDGSGLSFGTPENGVMFDLLGGGVKVHTAWPTTNNVAFLALDRNHDGSIEAAELFGTATENGSYEDGFEALRALDANGDLRIDRRDPVFAELVLWVDRNHDGASTKSELGSLDANGIESLDLAATRIAYPSSLDSNRNSIPLLSSYRTKDGTTRAFADVFLRFKP